LSRDQLQVYLDNEFFVELGMQEQLGASFPFAFPDLMGVVISRTRRTFTQRDRLFLDVVRSHASEAFRTAQWQVPCGSALAVDALEPIAGASVVVLDLAGEVQFCSERGQSWFQSFFAEERPFHGCLPLTRPVPPSAKLSLPNEKCTLATMSQARF
jgi:hypothetical protein